MTKYFKELVSFLNDNEFIVKAKIVKTIGSSPRNEDTEMFISDLDSFGTIGGGQLEYLVINHSRKMFLEI